LRGPGEEVTLGTMTMTSRGAKAIPKVRELEAVLGGGEGERPTVEVPFDVRTAFGQAKTIEMLKGGTKHP
jgi:hypothetical protein